MNAPVLHAASKTFTGLTGTGSVFWDIFDFSSAPFPASGFTVLRCTINIDCVAITSNDTGATYTTDYAVKVVYSWLPSGFTGTIVNSFVYYNNSSSQVGWSLSVGGAGSPRVTAAGLATTNHFNICMGARIVAYADA